MSMSGSSEMARLFATTTHRDPISTTLDEEQHQRLESLPYFHHQLNRLDTVCLLHRPGDFLLRTTASTGKMAVSVCWHDGILHFPIRKMVEGYCFESQSFQFVDQLVEWHRKNKVPVTRTTGAVLKEPKPVASWELFTHQLMPLRKLRPGHFGDVYVGKIGLREGTVHPVVIKTMSSIMRAGGGKTTDAQREDALQEARILRELGDHPHVVKYYGSTIDYVDGNVLTATELAGGRLDERLRQSPPLTPRKKALLATAAAKALLHVHCHGYVHRNVCSRKFLVELDRNKDVIGIKLAGFHFTERLGEKGIYRGKSTHRMPTPISTAIESLSAYIWTTKSDVWSWAVTVWEIYTNGAMPYHDDLSVEASSNVNLVLQMLRNGTRLRPHADMDETMLKLWRPCFEDEPNNRMSMAMILRQLNVL